MALWGITTFFNPTGAALRIENYRRFRQESARQGLPLVVVELAFGDDPFVLEPGVDAEVVVQRRSNTVLWQKERLLNLALAALPDACTGVCWIDADVVFEDDGWVGACEQLLREHVIIQPFSAAVRLPEGGKVEDFPGHEVGKGIEEGIGDATYSASLCSKLSRWPSTFGGTTGYAWCAQRGLLDEVGFYDRCIVGGGDRELALAIAYAPGKAPKRNVRIFHPRLRAHVRDWQARVYARAGKRIGVRRGVIHHLWHGSSTGRNYADRHQILIDHDYDPERDLVLDEQGCWAWAPGTDELAEAVAAYFDTRADG